MLNVCKGEIRTIGEIRLRGEMRPFEELTSNIAWLAPVASRLLTAGELAALPAGRKDALLVSSAGPVVFPAARLLADRFGEITPVVGPVGRDGVGLVSSSDTAVFAGFGLFGAVPEGTPGLKVAVVVWTCVVVFGLTSAGVVMGCG
jgi:hypothetical protein